MTKAKELKWGQTPWDNLPREQLLREVQRMYSAILSLNNVVSREQQLDPTNLYWSEEGVGGRALSRARQILDPLHTAYSSENIYRAFFRYAVDLLFDPPDTFGWLVCENPGCGCMSAPAKSNTQPLTCPDCRCGFAMRPLEWDDLKPKI